MVDSVPFHYHIRYESRPQEVHEVRHECLLDVPAGQTQDNFILFVCYSIASYGFRYKALVLQTSKG